MKKFLFVLVFIFILPICLCGCSVSSSFTDKNLSDFVFVTVGYYSDGGCDYAVLVDKHTRVMYLRFKNGYSGGITVLLDKNGYPMIYEGDL